MAGASASRTARQRLAGRGSARLDNLTELIRTEIEYRGSESDEWKRMKSILEGHGDAEAGEKVFRQATDEQTCTDCHGKEGLGDGVGPNLSQRFSQKTDWQLLHTVLQGSGPMPSWGSELSDEELTDLFAFLRAEFDQP